MTDYIIYDIIEMERLFVAWKLLRYKTAAGEDVIENFLLSLPTSHRAKAIWELDLLEKYGLSLRMPYVRSIKGDRYKGLMELRIQHGNNISRIFYFLCVKDTLVLLHGFVKKDQKTPAKELETALRHKEDFLRRLDGWYL